MMKIAYLIESTGLCGGVKVVFRQAEALMQRGHTVKVVSGESYPAWFDGKVPFENRDPFDPSVADSVQWVIGTTPRLVLNHFDHPAHRHKLLHMIQGYELDIAECLPFQDILRRAYSLPVPRITISQSMTDILGKRYPDQLFIPVGQGLEADYFYPRSGTPSPPAPVDRVFLIGPLAISCKRIPIGLAAVERLKKKYPHLKLIRISAVDTRLEEAPFGGADEYHVHIPPKAVAEIFRTGSGLLLSSSDAAEGFGLPALEAMACGVPVVLSDIPSYRSFSTPCDYAEFSVHLTPDGLASAAVRIMENDMLRRQRIIRGLDVAAQFSYDRVAIALEGALHFVSATIGSVSN